MKSLTPWGRAAHPWRGWADARARASLLGESAPDARTATLVAILAGCDLVGRLVPRDQRKAAEGRAEAAAAQAGVDEGLERAIKGAQLAVRTSTP